MHPLWTDYLAARLALSLGRDDLTVPIGETLRDVPIIPAERSHDKPENAPRPSRAAATATARTAICRIRMIGSAAAPRPGCGTRIA